MRKPDNEVKEVTCYETGKPMPKIPLWMAGIKVKFISDEARQRHPSHSNAADFEPIRRSTVAVADKDEVKAAVEPDEPDTEFEELETEEETADEELDE